MIIAYRPARSGGVVSCRIGFAGSLLFVLAAILPVITLRVDAAAEHGGTPSVAFQDGVRAGSGAKLLTPDANSLEERRFALDRRKLEQERQLKEKELALKAKELQQNPSWWANPLVLAIVAGFVGYVGTLVSSYFNLRVEREKQESNLLLEAIKTTGTPAEKEKQTAANLVFFADAGLIKSLKPAKLAELRVIAQGAGPSLPAPAGVEFGSSVTSDLQSKLQSELVKYQKYWTDVGYDLDQAQDRPIVRIDEGARGNSFFQDNSIILGPDLAQEPEYTLFEYTAHILKQSNAPAFNAFETASSAQLPAFLYGLRFYFICSYRGEPYVGKNFYVLTGQSRTDGPRSSLYDLATLKAFDSTATAEPHALGEIWGGAFWEIRQARGQGNTDRLLFEVWKQLSPDSANPADSKSFVGAILDIVKTDTNGHECGVVEQAFVRRKLY